MIQVFHASRFPFVPCLGSQHLPRRYPANSVPSVSRSSGPVHGRWCRNRRSRKHADCIQSRSTVMALATAAPHRSRKSSWVNKLKPRRQTRSLKHQATPKLGGFSQRTGVRSATGSVSKAVRAGQQCAAVTPDRSKLTRAIGDINDRAAGGTKGVTAISRASDGDLPTGQ